MLPIFELALALHTPVYELQENMSFQEFILWLEYFNRRPIGWREDDRTAKLLRAAGVKSNPEDLFHSLSAMKRNTEAKSNVPRSGSFMHQMLLSAKGGEKLDLLKDL